MASSRDPGGTSDWSPAERLALERLTAALLTAPADGLTAEVVAGRLVLAQLLRREADALRLAGGAARLIGVICRAQALAHPAGEGAGSLTRTSDRILDELGFGPKGEES